MTLNYLYTVGRQKIIVNATEEDSGQVGSVVITDQEEEIRVYEDAMDDDGSDAEDMTTMHVEREEDDGGGDEDKEYECDDLMDEEDGLLNDDSVLRAEDEDMSSHNDTISSDVLQPTSSAVVHASTSSSSRASNSRPSPSHSKPHPQTQKMKSKRPVRTLGLHVEYEEVSAAKIGGSFSVGCLPKHLSQPKGNALFPG